MFDLETWLTGLAVTVVFGVSGWLVSLAKHDVSIVDSMWSLMFLLCGLCYAALTESLSDRATLLLILLTAWSLRLSIYITWRNYGHPEDYRYQAIRKNSSPNFEFKSLYIVFGLQAVLAWFISLPLLAGVNSATPLNLLDGLGIALWIGGFFFESVGDYQLAKFKSDPSNRGKVLNTGLWGLTRHPNYFGDFCIWWGFFLIALAAGGWWSLLSPVLMSVLLLKVSGVAMLEKDIEERRPKYADYIKNTNAFFPGLPRRSSAGDSQ